MTKKFAIAILAVLLTACNPTYTDKTQDFSAVPKELKDCKIYRLSDGLNNVTVVRCPNSSTSTFYRSGKVTHNVTVIG